MKLKSIILSVFTLMMVTMSGLYLLSCGDKEDDSYRSNNNGTNNNGTNNNGTNNNGTNNEGGSINVPQELLGAWQEYNAQSSSSDCIYVFNADGTGKVYIGWDYTDNTAREVQNFVYSYNSQNSTLLYSGRSYTLAFKYGNSKMEWLIGYNDVFLSFYRHEGDLPTVEGNGEDGGGKEGQTPSAPTGIAARVDGSSISVSWQSVTGATSYRIYRSSSPNGTYSMIGIAYSASYKDNYPITGNNYYKVSALNNHGESQQSSSVECNYTGGGGGGNSVPSTPTGLAAVVDGS